MVCWFHQPGDLENPNRPKSRSNRHQNGKSHLLCCAFPAHADVAAGWRFSRSLSCKHEAHWRPLCTPDLGPRSITCQDMPRQLLSAGDPRKKKKKTAGVKWVSWEGTPTIYQVVHWFGAENPGASECGTLQLLLGTWQSLRPVLAELHSLGLKEYNK